MNTLHNLPANENYHVDHSTSYHSAKKDINLSSWQHAKRGNIGQSQHSTIPLLDYKNLLTSSALYQMSMGLLPDLWQVCLDLYHTFLDKSTPFTAMQFIPVLKKLLSINHQEMERFLENHDTHHVLIQNELLKVVLIHWQPGKYSPIHGHPAGGCVFKVLHGSIEEKRYTPDAEPQLIAVSRYDKGSMAYIDDHMAYHAVGNPFDSSAISLHVYTPGLKKS